MWAVLLSHFEDRTLGYACEDVQNVLKASEWKEARPGAASVETVTAGNLAEPPCFHQALLLSSSLCLEFGARGVAESVCGCGLVCVCAHKLVGLKHRRGFTVVFAL